MRRTHWWGAATGIGVAAVLVAGTPVAFAARSAPHLAPRPAQKAPAQKAPAQKAPARNAVADRGRSTARGNDNDHGNGHGGDGGHGNHRPPCPYPPHGTPAVTVGASSNHVHRGGSVVLSGKMTVNGCGYDRFPAGLYRLDQGRRRDDTRWVKIADATTGHGGAVSFSVTLAKTSTYCILTAPGEGLSQAASDAVTITSVASGHR